MKTLLLVAASVAAAVTLCLSGCSSDGDPTDSPPSGEADPFTKVVKYAECLRTQGLQIKINPGDGFTMPKDTDPRKREAAEAACRSVAPPGMYAKPSAEELDRYVKIAQCLRDQGVKVTDPTEERPQLRIESPPANLKQLQETCEEKVGSN